MKLSHCHLQNWSKEGQKYGWVNRWIWLDCVKTNCRFHWAPLIALSVGSIKSTGNLATSFYMMPAVVASYFTSIPVKFVHFSCFRLSTVLVWHLNDSHHIRINSALNPIRWFLLLYGEIRLTAMVHWLLLNRIDWKGVLDELVRPMNRRCVNFSETAEHMAISHEWAVAHSVQQACLKK